MTSEIFEYRNQARGPRNYIALGLILAVIYSAWQQGWGLMAVFLCGPILGFVLVRLIENEAAGFRMTETGLDYYAPGVGAEINWHSLRGVTIAGDGAGGAICDLHLDDGETRRLPATAAFAPERLAQEFRLRGIPVWRMAENQSHFVEI
ncbi:MAG TPA: hypothetical protein PK450_13890 [Paracoccaceae bacterium]|nr:hypothetical protein [Paracoccaceae bacterium]